MYNVNEIAQIIAANDLLATGLVEAAAEMLQQEGETEIAAFIGEHMAGVELIEAGPYGEAQYTYANGLRLLSSPLGFVRVEVPDPLFVTTHVQGRRLDSEYLPLRAAVEVVEAVQRSL